MRLLIYNPVERRRLGCRGRAARRAISYLGRFRSTVRCSHCKLQEQLGNPDHVTFAAVLLRFQIFR